MVQTRAFPDRPFPGRVTFIRTFELDPDSVTVQVRCMINNPSGLLKTGMYATITPGLQDRPRSELTVPQEAVQTVDDHTVVFVSHGGGQF